ncbi:hypothetical protein NDU88_012991 [Pleurodeles waltl]|uniref:MHC class I antigen n=1 Tax=Pleurodeles waltl TaxID=8319 RepID=A0AAV7R3B8_PLEWA|nr:hypothetical protein NDU88_012991 [Pleurodeles waltl]
MERISQTRGLHLLQVMYGCELRDDSSIRGLSKSLRRTQLHQLGQGQTDVDVARITQDRWNWERIIAHQWKDYLEGRCIEYLKTYLKHGEERLQRGSPSLLYFYSSLSGPLPGVPKFSIVVVLQTVVTRRKTCDRTFLTSYPYGFYPRDIEVKWVRNGVEIPWESRDILPHPDGTYQVRTTVEVQKGDDEKIYKYEVYHSSLPDTVTMMYGKCTVVCSGDCDSGVDIDFTWSLV